MNDSERFTRPEGEDEIRALLQAAGPRPEVAADELRAVRTAARQAWESRLAATGGPAAGHAPTWTRPRLALAATLLVALAAGWWSLRPEVVATVELARGAVASAVGAELRPGTVIETQGSAGEPAAVALRLADGQSLRLDAATRVRLTSRGSLELERGAVYLDSDRARAGAGYEIVTAFGTVRDAGTQFEVRLAAESAGLRVRVREGAVSLTRDDGARAAAREGEQLLVAAGGAVDVRPLAAEDADWQWMQAAAPGPDIEGMPLSVFLAWASRETGMPVRFADPALRRDAATIVLHGAIEDLTPIEALGVVLPGSGLEYRLEDGVVVVAAPAS